VLEHECCEQVIIEFGADREDMAAEILRPEIIS
jgi:hypothetical protein